jgi:hypothetical protein
MYIIHITFLLYSINAKKSTNKYYTHQYVICNFACQKSVKLLNQQITLCNNIEIPSNGV